MKNIPDRLTPKEAWDHLSAVPILPEKNCALESAAGHHVAQELNVPEDVPSADRSFMDGFAVDSENVARAPVRLRIAGEVLMGSVLEKRLQDGEAMSVPTGGFLPAGANAVVMQEDTTRDGDFVVIQKAVVRDENVQKQAEDFKKGDVLFPKFHRLRSQDLAALATFGIAEVSVIRKPNVAIISTGNELVHFRKILHAGQIRETNALALATAARQFGFSTELLGIIPDRMEDQTAAMKKAIASADVVLVSGGSSVGERDYTLDVIRTFEDSRIVFHGLAIRPGNPTIFGTIGKSAIFGLPGQPVSSLIVFYEFVLPFLFHLAGEKVDYPQFAATRLPTIRAILDRDVQPLKLKTDYVRLRLNHGNTGWVATPVLGKSASLSTLARADAYTLVPPGVEPLHSGEPVTAILFP